MFISSAHEFVLFTEDHAH